MLKSGTLFPVVRLGVTTFLTELSVESLSGSGLSWPGHQIITIVIITRFFLWMVNAEDYE